MGDDDAVALAEGLKNNDKLRRLAMHNNKITDKGCLIYMFSVREFIKGRRLWRVIWIPAESCLADDLTKGMVEGSGL